MNPDNRTLIIVAALAAIPPTITSTAAMVVSLKTSAKVEVVHAATNSMKDALVAVTRSDALQKGHAQGVRDQKAATKNLREAERKLP